MRDNIIVTHVLSLRPNSKKDLHSKVKFVVKFKYAYKDNPTKEFTKTIRIGNVRLNDWVDIGKPCEELTTAELVSIRKRQAAFKNLDHPLNKDYWQYHLLNVGPVLKENYIKLLGKINQI